MVRTYSYLGPVGTFTELALAQVPEAVGQEWKSVSNIGQALEDVLSGSSFAAMLAIENTVDGGVSATQDALANTPGIRIVGEYLVDVNFTLVTRPGATHEEIEVIAAHPVAYAQSRKWLEKHFPGHRHLLSTSNAQAPLDLVETASIDAAIASPTAIKYYDLDVVAENIGDNPNAQTRFVLVSKSRELAEPTGSDKTSLIVELPDEVPGALQLMLEQFSTRGVNLSLIQSRPIGDAFGRYRFVIDADGHIKDARVSDALLGLRRYSPNVVFLGSYPRADGVKVDYDPRYSDEVFTDAREWLDRIISGEEV
ncbi:MAG: prephenate dehydratase [Microbacteriaceae bacterium]|nr:prephenate dehydratase [Microbacteriaceae bacterium]